jgi:hypothetical protein
MRDLTSEFQTYNLLVLAFWNRYKELYSQKKVQGAKGKDASAT